MHEFCSFWIYILSQISLVCQIDTFSSGPVHISPEACRKERKFISFFILESLTCKVLFDIQYKNQIRTSDNETCHGQQPILEMYKTFVLREINHVQLLKQNRIFLERFS